MWIVARLGLAWASVPNPGAPAEIALLGVVALTVWGDARRRSEDVFLGNLGVPTWTIGAMALPLATLVELLVP